MPVIKRDFIITSTTDLSDFVGAPGAELTLREPANEAYMRMKAAAKDGDEALQNVFLAELPGLILDHNLYADETTKLGNEDIVKIVSERPLVYVAVLTQYTGDVLFTQGSKAKKS